MSSILIPVINLALDHSDSLSRDDVKKLKLANMKSAAISADGMADKYVSQQPNIDLLDVINSIGGNRVRYPGGPLRCLCVHA